MPTTTADRLAISTMAGIQMSCSRHAHTFDRIVQPQLNKTVSGSRPSCRPPLYQGQHIGAYDLTWDPNCKSLLEHEAACSRSYWSVYKSPAAAGLLWRLPRSRALQPT